MKSQIHDIKTFKTHYSKVAVNNFFFSLTWIADHFQTIKLYDGIYPLFDGLKVLKMKL